MVDFNADLRENRLALGLAFFGKLIVVIVFFSVIGLAIGQWLGFL